MPITVSVEAAQANFYQYLNQLDAAEIDKVIVNDGEAELCQIVTAAVFEAADPGGSGAAVVDLVAALSISPATQGKSLYRLLKRMRDFQTDAVAGIASGTITCVAKANIIDGEKVVLTEPGGTDYDFHFDQTGTYTPGGGYDATNLRVNISGATTDDDVAVILAAVIDGTIFTAPVPGAAVIAVTQSDPGLSGNVAITEDIVNAGFLVSGFAGGTDGGGLVAAAAAGTITCVAKANIIDGETAVLINTAGVAYTFHFNQGGAYTPAGGYGTFDLEVDISGATTADDVATILAGVIDGLSSFDAPAPGAADVAVTQSFAGFLGNGPIAETVVDAGFLTTKFSGGVDAVAAPVTVLGVKNSKNDAAVRSYIVPADHAAAIGL
jgi:predicted transcriptional regulator